MVHEVFWGGEKWRTGNIKYQWYILIRCWEMCKRHPIRYMRLRESVCTMEIKTIAIINANKKVCINDWPCCFCHFYSIASIFERKQLLSFNVCATFTLCINGIAIKACEGEMVVAAFLFNVWFEFREIISITYDDTLAQTIYTQHTYLKVCSMLKW